MSLERVGAGGRSDALAGHRRGEEGQQLPLVFVKYLGHSDDQPHQPDRDRGDLDALPLYL